jgi:solute carrier family 12 (potassium/chloride transporter), member 4/6
VDSYAEGITGLSITTIRDNWGSKYQRINNAGVPDPNGSIYWDFK